MPRRSALPCLLYTALATALALPVACGGSGGGQSGFADAGPGTGGDATTDGGGGPTCTQGLSACGSSCVDLQTSASNCGACGRPCEGGSCCGGTCVVAASSCSFIVTGVMPAQGNQNGGDWITITGQGFGAGLQVLVGDGVAPALALDPQHAIAQTPPGAVGSVDLTVVSGSQKAVLPQGFLYVAGTLQLPWAEKPMHVVRGEDPALAVLQDGRVLVAGGTTVPDDASKALTSAEIYTRSTDTVTQAAGAMSTPRMHDGAVTLLDGKVLVVGGAGWTATSGTPSASADLFDPGTTKFAPTHAMAKARAGIRAVLLGDGRVLVTSGGDQTAEVYDPQKATFAQVSMLATHTYGFAVRLRDGRALVGAGDGGVTACEIFDPAKNKFIAAGSLNQGRSMLTAHTLPDGRVMVTGGSSQSAGGIHVPLDSIELYDPAKDKWTVAPYKLTVPRTWHAGALVRDGTVLAMGGYTVDGQCSSSTTSVDQIDPVAGTVKAFGTLPHANTEWTAVTLQDGSVLGVGGGACGTSTALPDLDFLPGGPVQQ